MVEARPLDSDEYPWRKHLGQRNFAVIVPEGLDQSLNFATAAIHVANDVTLIFIRRGGFHLHHRLEPRPYQCFHGQNSSHFEGELVQSTGSYHQRSKSSYRSYETGQHTALNGFQNSLLHCGNVFTGNHAAHNLVSTSTPLPRSVGSIVMVASPF